jgi:hypothetical protein
MAPVQEEIPRMKVQFAALALSAAMLAGTSAAYACKDGCDCNDKKDASTATTTAAPATVTSGSASTTGKQEQTAQPVPGH